MAPKLHSQHAPQASVQARLQEAPAVATQRQSPGYALSELRRYRSVQSQGQQVSRLTSVPVAARAVPPRVEVGLAAQESWPSRFQTRACYYSMPPASTARATGEARPPVRSMP